MPDAHAAKPPAARRKLGQNIEIAAQSVDECAFGQFMLGNGYQGSLQKNVLQGTDIMLSLPFPDKRFMQLAWVVPDVRAAAAAWTRSAGVGPFFLFEKVTWDNPLYRGKPWDSIDITAAIAQAGDVQIELISQNEERPSMFRDVVPAGKVGLHHAGLYCSDYDANVAAYTKAGAAVAFSGLMMGSRVCWVDAISTLGFMVELIEANPVADSVFGQFRTAAANWDGKDPLRSLS